MIKKYLILLIISFLSVWASDEDKWWLDYQQSKKEIHQYINDIADQNFAAATWFLGGGKYGFSNTPISEQNLKYLLSAINKIAEHVWKTNNEDQLSRLVENHRPFYKQNDVYTSMIFKKIPQITKDHALIADKSFEAIEKYMGFLEDPQTISWEVLTMEDESSLQMIVDQHAQKLKNLGEEYFKAREDRDNPYDRLNRLIRNTHFCYTPDFCWCKGQCEEDYKNLERKYTQFNDDDASLGIIVEEWRKLKTHSSDAHLMEIMKKKMGISFQRHQYKPINSLANNHFDLMRQDISWVDEQFEILNLKIERAKESCERLQLSKDTLNKRIKELCEETTATYFHALSSGKISPCGFNYAGKRMYEVKFSTTNGYDLFYIPK